MGDSKKKDVLVDYEPRHTVIAKSDPSSDKHWIIMRTNSESGPFMVAFDEKDFRSFPRVTESKIVEHVVTNWNTVTSRVKRLDPTFNVPCSEEYSEYSWGSPSSRGMLRNLVMGKIDFPYLSEIEMRSLFDTLLAYWEDAYLTATGEANVPDNLDFWFANRKLARSLNAEGIDDLPPQYKDFYDGAIEGGISELLDGFADAISAGVSFADVFAI